MKYAYLSLVFVVVLVVGWAGFRGSLFPRPPIEVFPDMDRQPKFMPQSTTPFFRDGRTDRPPPPNTVARSLDRPTAFTADPQFTGADLALTLGRNADGTFASGFPIPVTAELMARGQERYTIYCAVCHGATGNGQGIASRYEWPAIANLHQERLITGPEGDIYNTITYGKNTMGAYGDKLSVEDRWAVVLYVRALQRAATGTVADVPAPDRARLGL